MNFFIKFINFLSCFCFLWIMLLLNYTMLISCIWRMIIWSKWSETSPEILNKWHKEDSWRSWNTDCYMTCAVYHNEIQSYSSQLQAERVLCVSVFRFFVYWDLHSKHWKGSLNLVWNSFVYKAHNEHGKIILKSLFKALSQPQNTLYQHSGLAAFQFRRNFDHCLTAFFTPFSLNLLPSNHFSVSHTVMSLSQTARGMEKVSSSLIRTACGQALIWKKNRHLKVEILHA
jgi:hypothetical protein